ncbi:hypothetical protein OEZ86_004637 [Tetradesmus obliquus]|nr:hypothetical protein OEZ86_004637 [Tetradesmus obliquus]
MLCLSSTQSCQGPLQRPARHSPSQAAAAAQPSGHLTLRPSKHVSAARLHHQQQQQWTTPAAAAAAGPRRQLVKSRAGPVDVMPTWTLDQIAGLAFGVLMVVCYFGAQQVDVAVAKQQRRQLGLCEECGGLYNAESCQQDKCPMKAKASR